jgi:hypothetical protein
VTLREEHRVRVFGYRALRRRILGAKKDEVIGDWRNMHTEELCNLQSSPNIIRVTKSSWKRLARHVACMGRRGMYMGFWWQN